LIPPEGTTANPISRGQNAQRPGTFPKRAKVGSTVGWVLPLASLTIDKPNEFYRL